MTQTSFQSPLCACQFSYQSSVTSSYQLTMPFGHQPSMTSSYQPTMQFGHQPPMTYDPSLSVIQLSADDAN